MEGFYFSSKCQTVADIIFAFDFRLIKCYNINMGIELNQKNNEMLPEFFRPILWSYDFDAVDPRKNEKIVIVNSINYGDLRHWRWLANFYGKEAVKRMLERVPSSEMRERSLHLASVMFNVKNINYVSRGAK